MKNIFLSLLFASAMLLSIGAKAQESSIYHRVNLKLGHSTTPSFSNWDKKFEVGNVRLEGNYGVTSFVEVGAYLGYDKFWNIKMTATDPDAPTLIRYQSDALFYGLNANLHIMPLLIKDKRLRVDLYVSGKIGAITMPAPENSWYKGTAFDYGCYAGMAYFITKTWGLYAEYGFNKKINFSEMEPCFRYGLTIKF